MENFIENPNLPNNKVSLALVDGRIDNEIEDNFKKLNIRIIKTKKIKGLDESISYHPDIMIHHIGGNEIVAAPNTDDELIYSLEDEGFKIILGKKCALGSYPKDVPYNAARFGDNVICNKKYTDEVLMQHFYDKKLKIIDVKQGYSKCNVCIVSKNAIITSDKGIHNIAMESGVNSLLIKEGNIRLFNINYGFIGGASGAISNKCIAFYGDVKSHPCYNEINLFLQKCGKSSINLKENALLDMGTIIPLKEYSIV